MGILQFGTGRALLRGRPATRYYVDASLGNDANDGMTPDNAWETIAKVNAATLNPGESVLFKRGETWAEMLTPPSPGATGKHIIFDAYGSGANPIIDGSALNHSLYIQNNTVHHLTFRNIAFAGATGANRETCRLYTHSITVTDCEIYGSVAYIGIAAWSNDGSDTHDIILRRLTVHDNATQGIYIGVTTATNGPISCVVESCVCYSNGTNATSDHGIYVVGGVEVLNNTCYSNMAAGIKTNNAPSGGDYASYYPSVHHNYCYSNEYGIIVNCPYGIIVNNLMVENRYNMSPDAGHNGGIYHNTLVNATDYGIVFNLDTLTDASIKNNIVIQDSLVAGTNEPMRAFGLEIDPMALNNTWDNNIYYRDGVAGTDIIVATTPRTFAEWQGLPGAPDANGILDHPDFVTDYTDLHLLVGSPCRGEGAAGTGVTEDYDGVTRGSPPDIGAYEYVP